MMNAQWVQFILSIKSVLLVALMMMPPALSAQEFGLDIGVATSSFSDGGGYAVHGQILYNNNLGYDLGYRYLDRQQYDVEGVSLTHSFSQYELGVFWQEGLDAARFQIQAGIILAGNTVETAGGEGVINAFTPGYRLDADLSLPFLDRLRVFTSIGHQGYYRGEMPDHWRWRYGLRMTFGGQRASELERVRQARAAAEESRQQQEAEGDNDAQPDAVPARLSQSLPPIVTHSEVCKCFPAGPFTLQLGEFRTMEQAVRALEFRGLRQLFTSVAYERSPQVVFLAQPQADGPVAFFLGEFDSLGATENWRRELRRHGLEGRVRRVVGSEGRIANRVRSVEDSLAPQAGYTEAQIARMNSLADDGDGPASTEPEPPASVSIPLDARPGESTMMLDPEPDAQLAMATLEQALMIGPLPEAAMQLWLGDPEFQRQWLMPEPGDPGVRVRLVWNAGAEQGWYLFDRFDSEQSFGQARAWLNRRGLSFSERSQSPELEGDIYQYRLGHEPSSPAFVIASEAQTARAWQWLLSPELLWFQAFQAINDRPAQVLLNLADTGAEYQIVATGFGQYREAQAAWRHLVSVGLQPGKVQQ